MNLYNWNSSSTLATLLALLIISPIIAIFGFFLKFTLKNDACVIIKVPNYDSVNRKIRKEKWCGFHFPDHVNQFTPKTLLKMVKDTNYEVLKFNFLDYLPTSDNMWMVVRPI